MAAQMCTAVPSWLRVRVPQRHGRQHPESYVVPGARGGCPRLLHVQLGRAVGLAVSVGGIDFVESLILTSHPGDVQ